MMSCGGTSHVTTRRDTLTILSIGQRMRTRPGPFSFLRTRPKRNTTARSYSRMMFRQLNNQTRTMRIGIAIGSSTSLVMVCVSLIKTSRVTDRTMHDSKHADLHHVLSDTSSDPLHEPAGG